ncbi:BglG family transcription antiterminator [Marinococcus sp. PL1-022]|uniref:BglG family transcription antiterminator n=1 Tax=Marinococcus sp. PL1-022 TaxID=3095363 RepID=UPI0029C27691|nr:BglG family transcription antiterminator [Marinococcus sp. PL1-022]MDX6151909.1 BglG family transcription antiterminator [Marinococcus sp. PL1-022]
MPLSERDNEILNELIRNPSVTSMALEEKHQLTRRQLGYSINKVNDWLLSKNLPVIERTRQGHFIIDQSVYTNFGVDEELIAAEKPILTGKQRTYYLIMMLVGSEEPLSLNHFTSELQLSKNTVLNELKEAQQYLGDYQLLIKYSRKEGYLVDGKEFQIRKLLMNVTYQLLAMQDGATRIKMIAGIDEEELDDYRQRIENIENKLSLKFTDEKLETMPYILALILKRIKKGYTMDTFSIQYEELSDTKEYQATEEIFKKNEHIPMEERLFITLHLLTANVYSTSFPMEDDVIPNLGAATDDMLRQFEKSACVYLHERDQLLDKLLQHIKPAYYRIKYQLSETSSTQVPLSKEFKALHHLVKQSTAPLEKLIGSRIPDSESSFITMLIGGWMKRQGESIEKKVKAIVVCPQGVSVSRLMLNELSELFPEFVFLDSLSVREFLYYPLEYDIVFAPTFLETEKKLFVVKTFLGREERQRLRKQVMLELYGYLPNHLDIDEIIQIIGRHAHIHNESALIEDIQNYINQDNESSVNYSMGKAEYNLDELITPASITLRDKVSDWEEAVKAGAKPLLENKSITGDYVNSMLRYTEEDPYIVIGPNIAIPHASPEDGVNEVGMSLLRLKEGVLFSEEYRINLVIVIAAVDKQKHIHALMQLMKLAGSQTARDQITAADSAKDIYKLIQSYSKD